MAKASQLPAELACNVFEMLSFADRISATHVCKRWRGVALAHELLWTRIRCSEPAILNQQLERARRVPVDVLIPKLVLRALYGLLEALSRHMHHIRRLGIYTRTPGRLPLVCIPSVYLALAHPAPLLEALDVQIFPERFRDAGAALGLDILSGGPGLRTVPESLFLGYAPVLTQLSFSGIELPSSDGPPAPRALRNISRLHLEVYSLSAAQLRALVSLPRLKCLHLDINYCTVPKDPAPADFQLDELWITGSEDLSYFAQPRALLHYFGFPYIRHFSSVQDRRWHETMTASPRGLPHTLFIEQWAGPPEDDNTQAWRMIHSTGFVSDLLDVESEDHFGCSPAHGMLSQLSELVILYVELRISTQDNQLEFNNLIRLCTRVLNEDSLPTWDDPWPECHFVCPKLRTLELWDDGEGGKTTMDGNEALDLVQNFLQFDAEHAPELILRNVDILESHVGCLAQLEGLVSSLRREGQAPKSFVAEFKSKWHVTIPDA